MSFVLMAPYLGFVVYYSRQFPSGQWPSWLTNTMAIWFIANFLALMLFFRLTRKMFKDSAVNQEKARAVAEKAVRTSIRLLVLWTLFFLYGLAKTVQGTIPLKRAIPAGAFLLFFIGLFGWSVYRSKRARKSQPGPLM